MNDEARGARRIGEKFSLFHGKPGVTADVTEDSAGETLFMVIQRRSIFGKKPNATPKTALAKKIGKLLKVLPIFTAQNRRTDKQFIFSSLPNTSAARNRGCNRRRQLN